MTAVSVLPAGVLPRGLSRPQAAEYLGVGVTLFDALVADGRAPPPKRINTRKVWDRVALDEAFAALPDDAAFAGLPDNAGAGEDANPWDSVIGE